GLGQKEPQPHHHWHFARCQRHRDQRLTVGCLPKRRSVLRRHADRALPLLRQRRVVDDQPGVITADHLIGLGEQDFLQRGRIPYATCYEVVQLIVADLSVARGHGLDALAIAGADQSRHVGWAHTRSRLVSQRAKERHKPLLQIALPTFVHGRPSKMPTSYESRKPPPGNPKSEASVKNMPK